MQQIDANIVRGQSCENLFSTQWRKSIVPERFIKTLTKKIKSTWLHYQNNLYMDKLNNIVYKCNNTYHSKWGLLYCCIILYYLLLSTYINFDVKDNNKHPKFKVGDKVEISKFKNTIKYISNIKIK